MKFHVRALAAPLVALALAFTGGAIVSAPGAQAADRTTPRNSSEGGFLGVRTQELTDDLRDSYDFRGDGVLVSSVSDGTPADRLGIREGDIITRIDNRAVENPEDLQDAIRSRAPGTQVSVSVWRNGRERDLGRIALGDADEAPEVGRAPRAPEAPEAPAPPPPPRRHVHTPDLDRGDDQGDKGDANKDDNDDDMPGMGNMRELRDLPGMPGMRGFMGPNGMMAFGMGRGRLGVELGEDSDHGALVTRVLDDTPAARAGLKAGDVITEFDGKRVDGGDDLRQMVRDHDAGDVELRVERRGGERTLTAHLPERQEMNFRSLPGGNGWQGWMDDRGNGSDKDKSKRRVYRYEIPNGGDWGREWQGLSPEDRAQIRKDIQQLRQDLERMRREMRERRDRGGDDEHGTDKGDDSHGRHDDSDDDDDSGN